MQETALEKGEGEKAGPRAHNQKRVSCCGGRGEDSEECKCVFIDPHDFGEAPEEEEEEVLQVVMERPQGEEVNSHKDYYRVENYRITHNIKVYFPAD